MKNRNNFILTVLIFLTSFALMPYAATADDYMPGEVLVKFKEGTTQQAANAANSRVQATLIRKMKISAISRLKLPPNVSVMQALEEFRNNPNVEYAQPNYIYRIAATPDDTNYGLLWGLNNTGQTIENPSGTYTTGTSDADIDAPLAWDTETGSTNTVVIAVIDTGVKWHHVDLYANRWENTGETDCSVNSSGVITCTDDPPADTDVNSYVNDRIGWDFVNNDNNPTDDCGHGTHVAGTIAAVGNNTAGVTGVMWTADLMPLKALGLTSDCVGTSADITEAIYYAVNNNAHIINMSLGGSSSDTNMYNALAYARDNNVLVIAAAGNDGTNNDNTPVYPASYDLANIVSVAATDQNDDLASFSNYGATSVDLAAPGVNVYSTVPDAADCTLTSSSLCDDSDYNYSDGTSMAAPHVAGVAGLYLANIGLGTGYATTKAAILDNVNKLICLSGIVLTGGRLNAAQTLGATITPSKVTDLSATPISTEVIRLDWTDVSSNTKYTVFRKLCSSSCSSYIHIGSAGADDASYTDTGLSENTCYEYVIRASNATDVSDHSNTASATTNASFPTSQGQSQGQDSGHSRSCFIATAAYGSSMHPYVEIFREFRDKHLLTNSYGKVFVEYYYKYSPPIADVIRDSTFLKSVTRVILTPVVMFVVYPYTSLTVFTALLMAAIIVLRRFRRWRVKV